MFVHMCMYIPQSSFMDVVLSEERASYNSLELIKWVGILQAQVSCVLIFRGEICIYICFFSSSIVSGLVLHTYT